MVTVIGYHQGLSMSDLYKWNIHTKKYCIIFSSFCKFQGHLLIFKQTCYLDNYIKPATCGDITRDPISVLFTDKKTESYPNSGRVKTVCASR